MSRVSLVDELNLEGRLEEATDDNLTELDVEASLEASNASPVVSLVDRILVQALERSASDIHLEPQEDGLVIRLRQDGVLEQLDKLPKKLTPAVTSRLKIMADLDIAERRLPQDGRIRRRYQGRLFDLRVSTLPTRYGEKVCMRLLDSGVTHLGLDRLISEPTALASVREMGSKPFGMLLVTGPTGSARAPRSIPSWRNATTRGSTSPRSRTRSNTPSRAFPRPRSTGRRATTSPWPCGPSCGKTPMSCWWVRPGTGRRPKPPSKRP